MVDIFDEVDEELREERMEAFLKKNGGLLFAACLAVIAGVSAWKGWQYYRARQDLAAASAYLDATERAAPVGVSGPNRPAAIAAFESVAASAPEGYRVLARFRSAALRADGGDLAGASAIWDQIAADGSVDPLLRDLASFDWCLYHVDQGDPAVVEGRLKPLATPGNPWSGLAREQLALLSLRQGQTEAARTEFKKLTEDTTVPSGVRGRAASVLERLGQ